MRLALLIPALAIALAACRTDDVVSTMGSCDTGEALGEVPHRELALSGDLSLLGEGGRVIRSEEELLRFRSATGVEVEAVNFDTEQILVASLRVGSTCGLRHEDLSWQLTGSAASAHLELQVTNPDGTCSAACDMEWVEAVAVAVPAHREGSACAVLTRTCAR